MSAYYDDGPFKIDQWNQLIRDVNDQLENPASGCDPISPIEEVDPPHRWSVDDVQEVRDKMMETCASIEFNTELDIWRQEIIDEIEEQIPDMWCDCYCEDETYVLFTFNDEACPQIFPYHPFDPADPCPTTPSYYDWFTAAAAVTGFGPNVGGNYWIVRRSYVDGVLKTTYILYGNGFDCAGNQKLPMPIPKRDNDGNLIGSSYEPQSPCYYCSLYSKGCFIFFCSCLPTLFGAPRCCENPPVYNNDPTCTCIVDEQRVKDAYSGVDWNCHTYKTEWVVIKQCPGGPHRKCCSDGISFCDNGQCPGDPACE